MDHLRGSRLVSRYEASKCRATTSYRGAILDVMKTYQANTIRLITRLTFKGAAHLTSNEYSFTGVAMSDADCAELAGLIGAIQYKTMAPVPGSSIIKAYCYSPGDTAARHQVDWTGGGASPGLLPDGTYTNAATVQPLQQAEVAYLFQAPLGLDTRGRRKRIRKFIHSTQGAGPTGGTAPNLTTAGAAAWLSLSSGGIGSKSWLSAGPTGTAVTGPWVMSPYLHTHQLREGAKRKTNP